MAALTPFNANEVQPNAPFELLPPGKYLAQIVRSDMKDTSTGGQQLVLELEILDGEFANRRVWDRLNLVNNNTTTVEIAQRTLSAICHATGQLQVADSEQLHLKPMTITVTVRPASGKFGASNEVRGYGPAKAGSNSAPPRSVQAVEPAAKPAAAVPPWRRNAAA